MAKRYKKKKAKDQRLRKKIRELALIDPLTGVYNHPYFIERFVVELKHAKRYIFPLSLIIIDIDYFESINDTYGHLVGDRVLKEFAQFLKRAARVGDVISRYGGATFAILSPDTNKEGSVVLGERFCEEIQKHVFYPKKYKIKLKISAGITSFPENGIDTISDIIDAAEKALRSAKDQGGCRVAIFESAAKKEKEVFPYKGSLKELKLRLKKSGKKMDQVLWDSIYALAKAIEARDHYTGEHAEKMVYIVKAVAKELGLNKKDVVSLERAAVLHDLGKIGISDKILLKKGKLTKREYREIKKHPHIGAEILRSIHFLKDVIPLILHHHERYDGLGYTSGLKGKDIPLGARILAIADVYQALISDRPYRKAYTKKEALEIIKEGSGTQFDPDIVSALLKSEKRK